LEVEEETKTVVVRKKEKKTEKPKRNLTGKKLGAPIKFSDSKKRTNITTMMRVTFWNEIQKTVIARNEGKSASEKISNADFLDEILSSYFA
jgi:hypothetical protein